MYKKNKFVILLLLFIIILYSNLYNKYLIKENFYTFYLPFYKNELPIDNIIYKTKMSNSSYMKNEFIYRPLKFGLVLFDIKDENINVKFINNIIKILLKSTNILEIKIIYLKDIYHAADLLNSGKIDLLYCSNPILNSIITGNSNLTNYKSLNNLEYICSLNFEYMYLISYVKNKYTTFEQIKGKKIGILNINNSSYIKYKLILNELALILKYKEDIDYTIEYIPTFENLFIKLERGDIDFIFYTDSYPSLDLNKIFTNDIMNLLYLIPIKIEDSLISSAYRYYLPTNIDLNFIQNYLPKKIKTIRQTKFKPDLYTYKYLNIICANKNLNEKIGYEITKAIYSNINILNKNNKDTNTRINKYNMIGQPMFINYNKGAFKFYIEKGFITYEPNPACKYLAGKKKCSNKILMNMKLI